MVTLKEVDAVINVMGQPEDYMVDEDIFDDEPRTKTTRTKSRVKKLYRDTEQKYISGVCSGLEHYIGLDSLWIRIIFIILAIFGSGFGLIVYIVLWILVPEATTTAQKLDMRGEPINISNIERKVKEGFDDVADKVKSVDYEKVGNKVKSGSKTFFESVGDVFMFIFKIFAKFIGIIMIIVGITTMIGLFIGLFTVGILDIGPFPWDAYDVFNSTPFPLWVVSLLAFFAIGIPFFFVFYLGLKILVSNVKSIGNIAKYSLLGLWLLAVGTLIAFGVNQAASHAYTSTATEKETLVITSDTLEIATSIAEDFDFNNSINMNDMRVVFDEQGEEKLYAKDVRLFIEKANDDQLHLKIKKDADGASFDEARSRAQEIEYNYNLSDNKLSFDNFLTTAITQKIREQQVRLTLAIPEGKTIIFDDEFKRLLAWNIKNDKDFYRESIVDYHWIMGSDGELKCLNCPEIQQDDDNDSENEVIIKGNGININVSDNDESVKMTLDKNGLEIKSEN